MVTNKTKVLILTLFALWLLVFSVSTGYALTLSEAQKLLASDAAGSDLFGASVSISGDTAVIGAIWDVNKARRTGSAYVFVRDDMGVWREQQKLLAGDGEGGDEFGTSVSLSGDTVLIGSGRDDDSGEDSGSAYIFVRDSAGVWQQRQKLISADGAAGDRFGRSVSLSAGIALIGAYNDDDNGFNSGSAYMFVRDNLGGWIEQQKLNASDGTIDDFFGHSVSISGNTAMIGAWLDGDNGWGHGSAYVFVRDGAGVWQEQQKLAASDAQVGDFFGWSVSLFADTAVIGSFWDDDNGDRSGSAYAFVRDSTGVWREQQKLLASDGAAGDEFSNSVAISGDTIVIGAAWNDNNGDRSGSAYVFVRDGAGVWSEQQKLNASDGAARDKFGSVSISADTIVIGAIADDNNAINTGSAYVFESSDPNKDLLTIEKLINHRVRDTAGQAAQLRTGSRYRVEYKVTNHSLNRLYQVQVFDDGELACNLYDLMPGQSKQPSSCANNQDVQAGHNNIPASVTAKVSNSNQQLANRINAYYNGLTKTGLNLRHFMNGKSADTQATVVAVNGNQADVIFRVENTGSIELYRVRTYHDPVSPVNSGWQEQCFIGTLLPGQVRYCKRTISVTQEGLNIARGHAVGATSNVNPTGFIYGSNSTYFNVTLP